MKRTIGLTWLFALAVSSFHVSASAESTTVSFDRAMRQGYDATAMRDYQNALGFFQKALTFRPDNSYATKAIANVTRYSERARSNGSRSSMFFIPTGTSVASGKLRSAATRGGPCFSDANENVIALVPDDKANALTTKSAPTLYAYIPRTKSYATFSFYLNKVESDGGRTVIYKKESIELSSEQGSDANILALVLPETTVELQPDKPYTWALAVMCDGETKRYDLSAEGPVQRQEVDPNLLSSLKKATPINRINIFNTDGDWYDLLDTFAELLSQPQDNSNYQQMWLDLLKSIQLPEVAEAKFGKRIQL